MPESPADNAEIVHVHVNVENPNDVPSLAVPQPSPLPLSPTLSSSLASSFVPVDSVKDAIQLIDEHKNFNKEILDYISEATHVTSGAQKPTLSTSTSIASASASATASTTADHRIISVFGSQSTGKSTLLNALFNTNFGVMDEINRQQTTKGIWLALSPGVSNSVSDTKHVSRDNILVMDVEGTDGRERGEDQDFERKAALFAMATSEVLIVNLWETQVGLYQGANMGLLKTVFEVNLSLFGTAKLHHNSSSSSEHKVLLLFVIRDHLGVTPKESLAATITQDLLKIWDNLNKPAEVSHLKFADFFDLAFHTLSHKVLQNEKFLQDVKLLGNRFIDQADDQFLFKPFYHHDIPIEGWTMYAENCWDQIDNNKDLDLPTQQILVAKFKCDEIVAASYAEFLEEFDHIKAEATLDSAASTPDFKQVGAKLTALKESTLSTYDRAASKYNLSVYDQRRATLDEKVNVKLAEILSAYSKNLLAGSIKTFATDLAKKPRTGSFTEHVTALSNSLKLAFAENLAHLSLNGQLQTNEYAQALEVEVAKITSKQQVVELNAIIAKHVKRLGTALKTTLSGEIANPSDSTWNNILQKFDSLVSLSLEKYPSASGVIDFGVGASDTVNSFTFKVLKFQSWQALHDVIHKHISKENLLNILKERFDDKFRYDQNGLPRLYQNAKELESAFSEAKIHAMKVFPILTIARLANGAEVQPEMDVLDKNLRRKYESVTLDAVEHDTESKDTNQNSDSEDEDEEAPRCFAEIVSEEEKAGVLAKFKKEIDAKFVETKRSIIQHVTQIPYYIYLVILVLGWNEFMAILRNPFFFTLLLALGAGVYVLYQTNLLGPALLVVQKMIDEAVLLGKQKLKELITDDHETHSQNLKKMGESAESIELEDLEHSLDTNE